MDRQYEHNGFVLIQTDYNWHYMIFDKKSKRMLLHASCTAPLTECEAKKAINGLLDHIAGQEGAYDVQAEDRY